MLNRLSGQITMTAGPALAGLIAAVPHLGLQACYGRPSPATGTRPASQAREPAGHSLQVAGPAATG